MILKKYKIRYIYKKIDINLIEQFKHQNEEKFLRNLMHIFLIFYMKIEAKIELKYLKK